MEPEYTTIRSEMNAYLGGEISLKDFYHWFMVETWDIEKDDEEYKLCCNIAGWFAEHTTWVDGRRCRSEEDLRVLFAGA